MVRKDCSFWLWSSTPIKAFKFQDYAYVTKLASRYDKALVEVGIIFDVGHGVVFGTNNWNAYLS